jgi:hypothetical protein
VLYTHWREEPFAWKDKTIVHRCIFKDRRDGHPWSCSIHD